jgi:hypothetical protein
MEESLSIVCKRGASRTILRAATFKMPPGSVLFPLGSRKCQVAENSQNEKQQARGNDATGLSMETS